MSSRATFMGVPPEIRDNIYNFVLGLNINSEVVAQYQDHHELHSGFSTIMYRSSEAQLSFPWVNLLLACKQVNAELGAYMKSGTVLKNEENRTYCLDMVGRTRGILTAAKWRRVPCHPSKVDTFVVNLHIEKIPLMNRLRTWGNGGPMPVVRQLYQTLNLMLHKGPVLHRTSPLPRPLKLKKMVMRITASTMNGSQGSANVAEPIPTESDGFDSEIGGIIQHLIAAGMLCGYIDHTQVIDGRGQQDFPTVPVDMPGMPAAWNAYGFGWGGNTSSSVVWRFLEDDQI
ncbi:hypothetical protein F5Y14DRAFT_455364 [Nemania sp. NC0429]|nr:hypothetical protein F5Y14DRAFT_455364 [Nemania sp. NC0429]